MEQNLRIKKLILTIFLIIAIVIIVLSPVTAYVLYSTNEIVVSPWKYHILPSIIGYKNKYKDYLNEEYDSLKSLDLKSGEIVYEDPRIVEIDYLVNGEFKHKVLYKQIDSLFYMIEHDTSWYYVSDQKKTAKELIKKIYTNDELNEIANINLNVKDFNKLHPIECMRLRNDRFIAYYMSMKELLCINFDYNGNYIYTERYNRLTNIAKYDNIKTGDNITDLIDTSTIDNVDTIQVEFYNFNNEHIIINGRYIDGNWYCISYDKEKI